MATDSIRFPKMHLAASVSNRILNLADGLPTPAVEPTLPPIQPDVPLQGAVLDTQLATPPVPAELPAGADGAVMGAALGAEDMSIAALDPLLNPAG